MEFYGYVNADGSVNEGCTGLTITNVSAGTYSIVVNDFLPITTTELNDSNMAPNANGTGVTKTVATFVSPISLTLGTSNPINKASFSEGSINANGNLVFSVLTSQAPSAGGASALLNLPFCFRIVLSTVKEVRM